MGGVIRPVIGGLLLSAAATGWLAQAPVWAEDPASRCNAQPMQPAQIRCFLEAAQAAGDPGLCASGGLAFGLVAAAKARQIQGDDAVICRQGWQKI